jgi:hypothetical protein
MKNEWSIEGLSPPQEERRNAKHDDLNMSEWTTRLLHTEQYTDEELHAAAFEPEGWPGSIMLAGMGRRIEQRSPRANCLI